MCHEGSTGGGTLPLFFCQMTQLTVSSNPRNFRVSGLWGYQIGFCLPSAKENWSENCSQASCVDGAHWWASHCKARILDVQIWRWVRWHQGFPLITRALHTLLIQIKGIHIHFHISLIILYMVLHVHLGSELHPYISSFLCSLLLHLLF